jgi:hypothetical protein
MLSRALRTATVTILIGWFTANPARAENLEAGKSPSQIFAGACSACHKGMRGLVKTVPPGSLPGFLRQHYTTSGDMAGLLSAYLLSNGASDPRGGSARAAKDAKSDQRPAAEPEQAETRFGRRRRAGTPEEAVRTPDGARPDADSSAVHGEPRVEPGGHLGRNARRRITQPNVEPSEAGRPAAEGQPAAAESENGPRGHPLSAKRKLSRRGKPGREGLPGTDTSRIELLRNAPPRGDASKAEPSRDAQPADVGSQIGTAKPPDEVKFDAGKSEGTRPEAIRPEISRPETPKSESPKADAGRDPVTPASRMPEGETRPTQVATPAPSTAAAAGAGSSNASETSAPAARPAPPAAEVSAPATSNGPPSPPISK